MAPTASPGSATYYAVPGITTLLSTASFLYLLRVMEHLSELVTNTHLLGSLLLGILWGSPHVGNLLSPTINAAFTLLGYIGLLLLIFAAGLTTPLALLLNPANLALSMLVAITGIALPFALSFGLLYGAYGYTILQTFGAGAALCSTSLGTTIALLDEEMRTRRIGVVLMTAALADDVVGLVIAGIVANLGSGSNTIHWSTIVRPVLVSLAFTFLTPVAATITRKGLRRVVGKGNEKLIRRIFQKMQARGRFGPSGVYLCVIISTLIAFVAGSHYAGTSELYGAYLAGTFLSYVFEPAMGHADSVDAARDIGPEPMPPSSAEPARAATPRNSFKGDEDPISERATVTSPLQDLSKNTTAPSHPILATFERTIDPLLTNLLSPLFFASIGASLPVQHLFTIKAPVDNNSPDVVTKHDVIWKGIVYSLLMIIAKVGTGVWVVFWPEGKGEEGFAARRSESPSPEESRDVEDEHMATPKSALTRRLPKALFLGLAMVARGEIALIVAQLARPLLTGDDGNGATNEEPFAVVIWAILVTTVCGAVGVGIVLKRTNLK
ncbi:sodium-hydrogen antiporter [Coprinopsis sp. MPI-PUGE-AT-0042]|nr:sodium-hydrogen antiporter [Coprinopsis sp. MPI-PUGE-AT-0042]